MRLSAKYRTPALKSLKWRGSIRAWNESNRSEWRLSSAIWRCQFRFLESGTKTSIRSFYFSCSSTVSLGKRSLSFCMGHKPQLTRVLWRGNVRIGGRTKWIHSSRMTCGVTMRIICCFFAESKAYLSGKCMRDYFRADLLKRSNSIGKAMRKCWRRKEVCLRSSAAKRRLMLKRREIVSLKNTKQRWLITIMFFIGINAIDLKNLVRISTRSEQIWFVAKFLRRQKRWKRLKPHKKQQNWIL